MLPTKQNRVFLTGGHAATTAIAVVQQIKAEKKDWKLFWVGVENAIEGKKVVTLESEALPRLGVKFLALTTGRLQRKFTLYTIPSILKIPIGFIQSAYYLLKHRPGIILSFGGFASFPVVFVGNILGIPVIVHEQTSAAGRSNQASTKFATKIAISRIQSKKYYPDAKCVLTGNPIMSEIKKVKAKSVIGKPPVIFITGGSRGSQSINNAVESILRSLLSKYKVIHQTGGLDYLKFAEIKQKLPMTLRNNYEVFLRVNPMQVSRFFQKADILVSRAGANTVSEILTVKRPSILIPLPISYLDEQTMNAKIAEEWGIAKIIPQKELTGEKLFDVIEKTAENFGKIVSKVKSKQSPDSQASKNLTSLVSSYLK